jgi:flagellar biosynthesis regulator FlaF
MAEDMTAQDYANIACLIAAAIAIGIVILCECNRIKWSERR